MTLSLHPDWTFTNPVGWQPKPRAPGTRLSQTLWGIMPLGGILPGLYLLCMQVGGIVLLSDSVYLRCPWCSEQTGHGIQWSTSTHLPSLHPCKSSKLVCQRGASPNRCPVGGLTDYHLVVAGCDAVSSQPCATPTGALPILTQLGRVGGRGGQCGVDPAKWLPRNRAVLFPGSPIQGEQTWRGKREESLVAWGGMTPSPVSYLPLISKYKAHVQHQARCAEMPQNSMYHW